MISDDIDAPICIQTGSIFYKNTIATKKISQAEIYYVGMRYTRTVWNLPPLFPSPKSSNGISPFVEYLFLLMNILYSSSQYNQLTIEAAKMSRI